MPSERRRGPRWRPIDSTHSALPHTVHLPDRPSADLLLIMSVHRVVAQVVSDAEAKRAASKAERARVGDARATVPKPRVDLGIA